MEIVSRFKIHVLCPTITGDVRQLIRWYAINKKELCCGISFAIAKFQVRFYLSVGLVCTNKVQGLGTDRFSKLTPVIFRPRAGKLVATVFILQNLSVSIALNCLFLFRAPLNRCIITLYSGAKWV